MNPTARTLGALLLLFVITAPSATAQFFDWPPTPQVFDIFRFDSSFVFGAHTILDPERAKNELHMTYSQEYQRFTPSIAELLEAPTGYFGPFDSARFAQSREIDFDYIFLLNRLPIFVYEARNRDAWFEPVDPDLLHNPEFRSPFEPDWYPGSMYRKEVFKEFDENIPQRFFYYLTVNPRTDPNDADSVVLMGGDPRFMTLVLARSHPDVYDWIYHIWHDEDGNERDAATADSLAAIYDKSRVFDVTVAIRAEKQDDDLWEDLDPDASIGYLDVFVRDTMQQGWPAVVDPDLDRVWVHDSTWLESYRVTPDTTIPDHEIERYSGHWDSSQTVSGVPIESCRCAIFRPLALDTITKQDYLDNAGDGLYEAGDNFVEISTEIDPSPYIDISTDSHFDFSDNPVWAGSWASGDERSRSYCAWLLEDRLARTPTDPLYLPPGSFVRHERFGLAYYPAAVEQSDVIYRFYTTRKAELSFVRGRLGQRMTRLIDEGLADSIIRHDVDITLADSIANPMIHRIGIADEVGLRRHRSFTHVNGVVQSVMRDSADMRGLWMNPPTNPDGTRIAVGDFDSLWTDQKADTNMKAMHMGARQAYQLNIDLGIPAAYLNPDSMSSYATETTYKFLCADRIDTTFAVASGDTTFFYDTTICRAVTRPADYDYRRYTERTQFELFGSFVDRTTRLGFLHEGGIVPSVARHVAAYRFDHRNVSLYSHPIVNVIQTHGLYHRGSGGGYIGGNFSTRIPTPEEIVGASWISVACNVNGLIFGDFQDDGITVGIMRGNGAGAVADEYGDYFSWNPFAIGDTIPTTWLGRASRYAAVKEVTTDIHHIDTAIGFANLLYEQDQMSLHDTRMSFDDMPMLEGVTAERAGQHNYSYDEGTDTWTFVASDTFDVRAETFMEVTQFYPSTADSIGASTDARYLLFVNRRLHPIDTNTYTSSAVARFDEAASGTGTSSTSGLGAIDVRRPVVTLKNSTSTIADSLIVEKISLDGTWVDTVAVGSEIPLDWLRPGRGAFYRVTPIPRPYSYAATGYNNSVHAENTATDEEDGARFVVVERDSAVWLRSFSDANGWGEDLLVSEAADTVRLISSGTRTAHATTPAMAVARDDSATLIVWQRTASEDLAGTVDGLWFPGTPSAENLDSALSITFSTSRLLDRSWMTMNPSVVGVNGGWIIAWGSPGDGIELRALRNTDTLNPTFDLSPVSTVKGGKALFNPNTPATILGPICKFPTLAYLPNDESAGTRFHLAWQQGQDSLVGSFGGGPFIMYKEMRIDFDWPFDATPAFTLTGPTEHVSQALPGCSFMHPSIAVDSTRVGIAFESRITMINPAWPITYYLGTASTTTLRFRDSTFNVGANVARPWRTPVYYWGDDTTSNRYPSLTQFPARSRDSLLFDPAGALVWYDENSTSDHGRTAQTMYRYGDVESVALPPGDLPSMMLAPHVGTEPLGSTGVLYRGDTTTAHDLERGWGEDATYYSTHLLGEATGAGFTGAFAASPKSSGIFAGFSLGDWYVRNEQECDFEVISGGIVIEFDGDPNDDVRGDDDDLIRPTPAFFGLPGGGATRVDSLADAAEVARTAVFAAPDEEVSVRIYVGTSPNVASWLDQWPYDSTMGSPADVKFLPELVRSADSVVLWHSDTISARYLTGNVFDVELSVPVDDYASVGESVFIRLRPIPTAGLGFDMHGLFHFFDGNAAPPVAKPPHRFEGIPQKPDADRPDLSQRTRSLVRQSASAVTRSRAD